jgi:hypothetical protein
MTLTRWDVLAGREETPSEPEKQDHCACCGHQRSDFKVNWQPMVTIILDIVPGFQKTLCLCRWCYGALYQHFQTKIQEDQGP